MGGCCCCCSSKGLEVNTSPPFYHYPRVGEEHEPLSSHNTVVSTGLLIVDTNLDTSVPDTYRPPPAPIQYDSNLLRPVRTESENVGDSNSITNEPATKDIKEDSNCKVQSDIELVEDELEKSGELKKPGETGEKNLVPEEEDVCPTCLEEYDEENPKIVTKCEHHFHLSCILEWLERSDTCPVCDQEMIFNHTNEE